MNKKRLLLITDVVLMLLLIAGDQASKYLAIRELKDGPPFIIWDGVFELRYLENRGAAFGMLQGQKAIFILITVIVLAAISYVLYKAPYQKRYTRLHISLVFIASGAIGNLIDRVRFDHVVDFFYFSLINFPIFNVADIFVTLSSIYLVILLIFVYKENDLDFLSFRTKKFRDIR